MPSGQDNHDNIATAQIQSTESHNLIVKLYSSFLTNNAVQNGLKQLTRFSQPLMGRVDDNLVRFTSNVSKWVSQENIYNHLANLWMSLQFPFDGKTISYEQFSKEFESMSRSNRKHENEFAVKTFYGCASEIWRSLAHPTIDDIKNALLAIVAKAVNKTYHFQDETLANALYNMLRMLIEKRRELVSAESFENLIKVSLGDDFWSQNQQIIKSACDEYYAFAKRFILIDFPIAVNHKDILKLVGHFIQNSSLYYGDFTLNFIEKTLDFFLRLVGQDQEQVVEDKNLAEKAQRILNKAIALSTFPIRKTEDMFHQVQLSKPYVSVEQYLRINERIDEASHLASLGYNMLRENILQPSMNKITVITNRARTQVTVILHDLDVQVLKKKYNVLHAKYEILQNCVVIVADETLKLVFDKQALAKLGENGKKELLKFYHEVKALEIEKVKETGIEYYSLILKKAQKTYTEARKNVYYKKREIGDQDTAAAIRPDNFRNVDAQDTKTHVDNAVKKEITEHIPLENN